MKKIISSLILLIMICNIFAPLSIAVEDTSDIIIFGDEKLKKAFINYGADTNNDGNLTINELSSEWLTYLYSSDDITNLSGIEYATNLTEINLYNLQSNVDFGELSKLPNLQKLTISGKITDITSLQQVSQLKELSINAFSATETVNLEPVKNLTNLESLILNGNISNHQIMDKLSNLKNLEINIYNTTDKLDMSIIGKMTMLEKLSIQNISTDIAPLASLTNLKELTLSLSYSAFDTDLSPINRLEKLEKLSIGNVDSDVSSLANLTNLKELSLYFANNTSEGINQIEKLMNLEKLAISNINSDLPDLSKLTNLKELTLMSGMNNLEIFSNMDKIKTITTLEKLELSGTLVDISGLEELTNLKQVILTNQTNIYNLKENEFVNTINKLKANDVLLTGTFIANLGNIICGETQEINFEDISPILKSIMTEGDALYNSNLQLSGSSYGDMSTFTIDNENNKVKITANKFGNSYSYVSTNNYGNTGFCGSFMITWHNVVQGDTTKEIEFKDENLKNALLENYDIDDDKKITENDMINYSTIDLSNKNIADIAGLEHATNLTTLDLSNNDIIDITTLEKLNNLIELKLNNNKITDLSPLKDMLKIEDNTFKFIHMQNNFVEDVTCLVGCNFECLDLKGNYIDFSEGSENRKVVEDSIEAIARKKYIEYGITNITEEEYVEQQKTLEIDTIINTWYYLYEKYGSVAERNDEVEFETELKQALIEAGVDSNNDSKITKGELNDFKMEESSYKQEALNLSNLNISNIEGLKYLSNVAKIDLSNNNISDISPLKECRTLEELDLSNNKISDITTIGEQYSVYNLNLSNNNITNIDTLKHLRTRNTIWGHGDYWSGGGGSCRNLNIDLSNNKITNISAINQLRTLEYINLSNNMITDISSLKDYNFQVEEEYGEEVLEEFTGIDLSGNYINLDEANNKAAITVFEEKDVTLTLTNQKELKNTLGDPSGDGKINTVDAIRILQYISKKVTLDNSQMLAADTNGDGKINTIDVIRILQYISKKITEF